MLDLNDQAEAKRLGVVVVEGDPWGKGIRPTSGFDEEATYAWPRPGGQNGPGWDEHAGHIVGRRGGCTAIAHNMTELLQRLSEAKG